MSVVVMTPVKLAVPAVGSGAVAIGGAVSGGQVRNINIHVANIHATDDGYINAELYDGTNSLVRYKNYPLPNKNVGSGPDLELLLPLPAGWSYRLSASAANLAEATMTGTEAAATDIA